MHASLKLLAVGLFCVAVFQSAISSSPKRDEEIDAVTHEPKKQLQSNMLFMISRVTGKTIAESLTYLDYGCFCGQGNVGETPVDDLDRCCYNHDNCYDKIQAMEKCGAKDDATPLYFTKYLYTESKDKSITCTEKHNYLIPMRVLPWDKTYPIECRIALCECDAELLKCFAKSPVNSTLFDYDLTKCL